MVAACSQAPTSPPAMCPAPFMYGLGGRLALEMARGRRKELAKWLRHILRPQYPRLLCIRLRSCMASIAAWPWKWPGGVERGWRCGCGLFSGPNIAACYVSGSVHVWPVAGWPWKWPGAVERGWQCGCGIFSGPKIPTCYVSGSVHVWPRWQLALEMAWGR